MRDEQDRHEREVAAIHQRGIEQYLSAHEMTIGIVFVTARSLHQELGHRLYGTETNGIPEQGIGSHWLIDPKAGVLMGSEEPPVPLSRDEARLLEALLENRPRS